MTVVDPAQWLGIKLARAVKHVQDVHDEDKRLVESDDCGVVADFKSDTRYLVIKAYMRSAPSPFCGIYIGEALYQFRSVLDHLTCYLTESNGQVVEDKTEFPIFLARGEFLNNASSLTRRVKQRIGGILHEHQTLIEREQPFQGKYGAPENDPLWWLYRLSNFDRLLTAELFAHRSADFGEHDSAGLHEDRVRREDRARAFGDRHGPCVGRLHNSCGIRAEFGSGVVLVDKKALPLIQLATCHGC